MSAPLERHQALRSVLAVLVAAPALLVAPSHAGPAMSPARRFPPLTPLTSLAPLAPAPLSSAVVPDAPLTDAPRAWPSPQPPSLAPGAMDAASAMPAEVASATDVPDGACTVALRDGARATPDEAWHVTDRAVKANGFPSSSGHPSGRASYDTTLRVEACVPNRHAEKSVWIDAHVLDAGGRVIHRETLALRWTQGAGDGRDRFVHEGPLYHGSVATPGSVDPRPDARSVEYRLYCEQGGEITTDGRAHRCTLRSDVTSG